MLFDFPEVSGGLAILLAVISLWDLVWKAIGLWKSSRNNQLPWFIFILIFNTAGLLPIVYLLWFQKKNKEDSKPKRKR